MPPRTLTFIILASAITFATPTYAKDKKNSAKQSVQSWKTVAEYVLNKGSEKPVEAPSSRTLGYTADSVPAKSLRIKSSDSKDKKEHTIRVTYALNEKGTPTPIDINLGNIFVKTGPDGKMVDGYIVRIGIEGNIISAIHASGLVGEVELAVLEPDSKKAIAVFNAESALHLKSGALEQLTQ